ncbi:MAG: benzoate-CoA ligase family protein [Thermoanaerobaculia bacterium]
MLPIPEMPEVFNLAEWLLDARVAEGNGDRIALRLPDRSLTYAEVQALANRFAGVLQGLGLRREERVFIALPDGAEFVGALFGTLKAGAVVVMLNPDLAPDAVASLYEYLSPRLAIIDSRLAPLFGQALATAQENTTLLAVGDPVPGCAGFAELARSVSGEFNRVRTHRDDPAVLLFSGGTTGRPKAVVQSHRSYAFTTQAYGQRILGLAADDITLAVPKLYFGYAMGSNLFFPFSVGASACLFPEKATADSIFAAIRRHRPTVLVNVPTLIQQMVAHPQAGEQDLSSLRVATSAGEALAATLRERWNAAFGVELLDGLGTAEQWHVFLSHLPGRVRAGTLGEVVPGFEVQVRDDDGHELPHGEIGQLWVRGGARAWGYFRELEKTQATFRGEWVVTGDLVSRDTDGFFTYQGRDDDVFKVAGRWFSPAEVEGTLLRHPQVGECAVVGIVDGNGLVKPQAWVIPKTVAGQTPPAAKAAPAAEEGLARELSDFVARELAPYKAPRIVHIVADLPRTHLGKIDRGALKRPPAGAADAADKS